MASDDGQDEGDAEWPWSELGMESWPEGDDAHRLIRRAYAKRLKSIDAGHDVAAFSALRRAYETALDWTAPAPRRAQMVPDIAPLDARPASRVPAPAPRMPAPQPGDAPDPAPLAPDPVPPVAQPGDAPVSDPLPDAPDAALDRQADDAQPGDAPRPATPSPWGTPLDEALTAPSQLLAHIDRLLEGQRQSIQTWRVILDAPLLDSDPFLRRMVEGRIIAYLSRTDVHSYENRQAFATLADARFGWRIDGIGLLRRHPNAHGILEMLPKPRRQPDPARQPETGRRLPLWARWPVALIAVTIPVALLMAVFGNTLPEGSSFGDLSASVLGPLTAMCMLLAILFLPGLVVWKIFSFIVRRFFWWHRLEAAFWRRWRNGRLGRFSPVDVFATALVVVAALVLTPVFTEMINWSGETRQQTPEDMPGYQRILPPAAP